MASMVQPVEETIYYVAGSGQNLQLTATANTNISGWTIVFAVRAKRTTPATEGTLLFSCSTTGGDISITDPTNGVFVVDVVKADTLTSTPGIYRWDVWRTDSTSEFRLRGGEFHLLARQIPLS